VNYSRRDLRLLLPALAAAGAAAQNKEKALPSKTYLYEEMTPRGNGGHTVLDGHTHTGFTIEMHETVLEPGKMPHAPHHHVHEEMIIVREGTVEVTILGKSSTLGPGSVGYVASNEEHGWKNVGSTKARYWVLAFGAG
jgi:quercetin dioxygenase-like cupin family protein